MCGIAGFIDFSKALTESNLVATVTTMANAISHRGPDSAGSWVDPAHGVALGHRRLAIVDLSPNGHQPMTSSTGRYIITFNGEIYNFLEIKAQLVALGFTFKGGSDTEVLLAAIDAWGLPKTLEKINGMFAFALWDKQDRRLFLARDRVGKKPLYYGFAENSFLFGSELKALRVHPDFIPEIDRNALAAYMRHNYVPAPLSIYQGIHKLPPATYITVESATDRNIVPVRYWDFRDVAERGAQSPLDISDADAISKLNEILSRSVQQRMISDVPLGSFLSGGIDSSLVTALMQSHSATPIQTFSIGFETARYDESKDAKSIAEYLGTDHTELMVTAQEALAAISEMPSMFDEPFADSSQVPAWHVAKLARQSVTVALSGDGGDESFGGYERYQIADNIAPKLFLMPQALRTSLAVVLRKLPASGKTRKLFEIMDAPDQDEFYRRMLMYWKPKDRVLASGNDSRFAFSEATNWPDLGHYVSGMMYHDTISYLPDDILTKVDRTTMAVALEARSPLLDKDVIEFAWSLPMSMKRRDGHGKWILRQLLEQYIPKPLFDRPKQGFSIPVGEWLRGPLYEWAENLLNEERLVREGFFSAPVIRERWKSHLARKDDWSYHLWGVLMFQAWYEAWHPSKL